MSDLFGWTEIKNEYPPYPNGGEKYLASDGTWIIQVFFHIDPTNNEKWWESIYGLSIKDIEIKYWRKSLQLPGH